MNFRMLMAKKILDLYFLFLYRRERKPGNERSKQLGLDWLVSFTDMYFPCNALVCKYCPLSKFCLYGVHETSVERIVTFTTR